MRERKEMSLGKLKCAVTVDDNDDSKAMDVITVIFVTDRSLESYVWKPTHSCLFSTVSLWMAHCKPLQSTNYLGKYLDGRQCVGHSETVRYEYLFMIRVS